MSDERGPVSEPEEQVNDPGTSADEPEATEASVTSEDARGPGTVDAGGAPTPPKPPARGPSAGRRRRLPRGIAPIALIAALAVAWLLPNLPFLALGGGPASQAGDDMHVAIGNLPDQPTVLVDMDPDLGTYPEIRFATRAALADLFAVGARVAMVSFSPEGRAIAIAEIARLRDAGAGPDRLVDLGFRSGGEAALVQLTGQPIDRDVTGATNPVLDQLQSHGGGLGAFDLALVVGGDDMSPRSWIEQVEPRVPKLPVAAITPTFLLPEMQPYRDAGQLVALAGTLPEGVAYGTSVVAGGATSGPTRVPEPPPNAAAILLGMLVAIAVLLESGAGAILGGVRGTIRGWRS